MRKNWISALALAGAMAFANGASAQTIELAVDGSPAGLDPHIVTAFNSVQVVSGTIYESLTMIDKDLRTVPGLAESWQISADNLTYTFRLRSGVTFHDGKPAEAADVVASLKRVMSSAIASPLASRLASVADATAPDARTVVVTLKEPTAPLLTALASIAVVPRGFEADKDGLQRAPMGTGPFKFKEWRRGAFVEIDANKDYWGNKAKIDAVRFLVIPNGDTALAQYEAGELDVLDVQESTIRRVMRDTSKDKERQVVPRAQSRFLAMNPLVYAPFKDKRVREAISLTINRDGMIRGFYDNAAFQLHGITTPGVAGYFNDLPKPKYDPEAAKKLLAEAGFPGGKGLPPIDISSTAVFKDELTYYANELNRTLGMQVNVNVVERATFIRAMNAGEVAFFPWGWTSGYPDAMYYLEQMWHSKSPYNRGRWFNAKYDALIDEATATVDDAKRFQLYRQAEMVYIEDFGAAPLPMVASIALVKPNVTGARATPFGFDRFVFAEIK